MLESEDWPPLSRGRMMALDKWYGGGLILTEGAEHHRQRDELWKPVLADPAAAAGRAVSRAGRRADSWTEGAPIELFTELRSLCWSIEWETLTGEDLDASPELLQAQEAGIAAMQWLLGPFGAARWDWPMPASARTRAARDRLDAAIDALIAERRARPREDVLSRFVASESDDALVRATFKQWLGSRSAPRAVHVDAADAGDAQRRRGALARRARRGARRARGDRRGPGRARLHPPGDQGVDAAVPADPGLLPRGDGRLRRGRDDDSRGPRDRDEPVGDPPRRRPVARAAALRPRPLGRRRAATAPRAPTSPSRPGRTSATPAGWRPRRRSSSSPRSASGGPSGPWTNASRGRSRPGRSRPRAACGWRRPRGGQCPLDEKCM